MAVLLGQQSRSPYEEREMYARQRAAMQSLEDGMQLSMGVRTPDGEPPQENEPKSNDKLLLLEDV